MVEGQSSKWWVLEEAKVLRDGDHWEIFRSLEASWNGSLQKPELVIYASGFLLQDVGYSRQHHGSKVQISPQLISC